MVLSAGQWYFVRLCEEKCSIQTDIVVEKGDATSVANRRELIEFIEGKLQQICSDLMPAAAKPEACVPCPLCSEPHIKYRSLLNGHTDICRKKQVFIQDNWYKALHSSEGTASKPI